MKLLKVLVLSSIFLITNIFAATISGNTYCDTNGDGNQDPGETCPFSEGVWVKAHNIEQTTLIATQVEEDTGNFSFDISYSGPFNIFFDDNGQTDDFEPTPLANTQFHTPSSGSHSITLDGSDFTGLQFGLEPAEVCKCNGDGVITTALVDIDGNMSEWASVFLDPDNTQCDSAFSTDYDTNRTHNGKIPTTGRNLLQFSRTVHPLSSPIQGFAYGATRRIGSHSNTEVFLFYRGGYDGKMHTTTSTNGNVVLAAQWHGSNSDVMFEICDYVEAEAGGDPMFWQQSDVGTVLEPKQNPPGATVPQEWVGKADGYTIHGTLENCDQDKTLAYAVGSNDGLYMEYMVSMSVIKLDPNLGFPTYHVSTTNTRAGAGNHPPMGVDDNMGPCPLAEPQISLSVNKTVDNNNPYVGENVTYTITVTNSGDATSSVEANDTLPPGVTYASFSGTNWNCTNTPGEQLVQCRYTGVLGGGSSSSVDIIASVDAGTQGSPLTNEVCVNSDENTTLVCDYEDITVASNILQVSKGVSNNEPYVNSIVAYEINVTNTGPNIAYNVVLNDPLPFDYIGFSGANWECTETSTDVIDCNYTHPLGVGEMTTITFGANVPASDDTLYLNRACAHSEDNTTDICSSIDITTKATPTNVVLETIKVVDNKTPLIGDIIFYTISVTNVGSTDATDVNVTDTLPGELRYINSIKSAGKTQIIGTIGAAVIWNDFNLSAGASETLEIRAQVTSGTVGDPVNNEACAVAEQNTTEQCGNDTFTPRAPNVTMLIEKSVDNELPKVGSTVTYTLKVTNDGTDTAHDVNVTDQLPPGVTNPSYVPSGEDYDDTTANVWIVGDLAPGTSKELNITVEILPGQESNPISNNACVKADENMTDGVCDDANLTVGHVNIQIRKLASDSYPAEGDDINYTIIVTNIGDVNATNITVVDTLPDQVSDINAGGNGWSCNASGQILTCINPTLTLLPNDPGSSFDVKVTVDPGTAGTTLTNTACVEVSENPEEQICVDRNITINDELDLSVTKEVDNPTPKEESTIVYTIAVTNHGDINATNVVIKETIFNIAGVEFVSYSTNNGSIMSDNYTWDVGMLESEETAELYITANVIGVEGGTWINNAALSSLDQTDTDPSNNSATASITITCPCDDVSNDSLGGGCTYNPNSKSFDMMYILMMLSILFFGRRELKRNER